MRDRYLKTGERKVIGYRREVTGQRKDGGLLNIELLLNEIDNPNTGGRAFVAVLQDVTRKHCGMFVYIALPS
jgi:two-component system sensor kinase FixL